MHPAGEQAAGRDGGGSCTCVELNTHAVDAARRRADGSCAIDAAGRSEGRVDGDSLTQAHASAGTSHLLTPSSTRDSR